MASGLPLWRWAHRDGLGLPGIEHSLLGVPSVKPVIGTIEPQSLAARSGLQSGMEIVSVGEHPTVDWEAVTYQLVRHIRLEVELTLRDDQGRQLTRQLQSCGMTLNGKEEQAPFAALGFETRMPEVLLQVGQLVPKGSAEQAGLQVGDELVALDGVKLASWQQFVDQIKLTS